MNDWDGFDGTNGVPVDEKEEKRYESLVWKCLLGVFGFSLLLTVYIHSKEIILKYTGQSIVAKCSENSNVVSFNNEEGIPIAVNVEGIMYTAKDGQVMLYYYDNMRDAKPMTGWGFWCISYLLSGVMTVVSVYKIFHIYNKKEKHSTQSLTFS